MPSTYVQPEDYATFGVPASATEAQVVQASALLDAYLQRPEGLLYATDANGAPAYMLNKSPNCVLRLADPLVPTTEAVTVAVTGPTFNITVGDVFIAETGTPDVCESLVVNAVNGANITFASVQFPHAIGAQLTGGLLITEQRSMPQDRPITRVSRTPIVSMPSGTGRYGYLRRGDDGVGNIDTFNLLAVMSAFGGPPAWEAFTPQANSINADTGELWIPAGVLLAYYTEIRVQYISGWTYDTLPAPIKIATGQLVAAIMQGPMLGNVKAQQAGGTKLEWFAASQLSADVKALVDQYSAKGFL